MIPIYQQQRDNIEAVGHSLEQLGASQIQLDSISSFMEECVDTHYVYPMNVYTNASQVGVCWETEKGRVQATFADDKTWSWRCEFTSGVVSSFSGMPLSYHIGKSTVPTYFYSLPSEVMNVITRDEPFEHETTIQRSNVRIVLCDCYYDGPLSGYCVYQRRLYRFDLEEETDIRRHRQYAVRQIPTWMCILVGLRIGIQHTIPYNAYINAKRYIEHILSLIHI